MKRLAGFLVAVAVLTLAVGCGPKAVEVQARMANTVAVVMNSTSPLLIKQEQSEGDAAIDAAKDKAAARAAVADIKERWQPVWDAYDAVRIAQGHWATALEQGGDTATALTQLKGAFCDFKGKLPGGITLPPEVTAIVCEVGHDAGK